ncbi:MAG: right-handed parallel beta-helix repeat-containing protein [Limisphaerales bacterium]
MTGRFRFVLCFLHLLVGDPGAHASRLEDGCYRVRPGESIQEALDQAAADPSHKIVRVGAGTYRPTARGQALIGFNYRHDGVRLEADGEVTLTAAAPELADPEAPSFPAVVNHVVYFGDGISSNTVLRGFRITGGNRFATDQQPANGPLEPRFDQLRKTEGFYGHLFFYTDGAGIKIFGRSYPTLENLEVVDNEASPCGGGISIEHRGFAANHVTIRDSVFRDNRALVTGSAVDLLPGSSATLVNCLFVGNRSNLGNEHTPVKGNLDWPNLPALIRSAAGYLPENGSGAVTVFPGSFILLDRCTLTANRNGLDDRGSRSVVRNCIFWRNNLPGGARSGSRYELDIARAALVERCFIGGDQPDLRRTIDPNRNTLHCPDPDFDDAFRPRHPDFKGVGYRPVSPSTTKFAP